jgi:hypothetical protein
LRHREGGGGIGRLILRRLVTTIPVTTGPLLWRAKSQGSWGELLFGGGGGEREAKGEQACLGEIRERLSPGTEQTVESAEGER